MLYALLFVQDWHGNIVADGSLLQGFVTAEAFDGGAAVDSSAPVTAGQGDHTCSTWAFDAPADMWYCNFTALTIAATYDLYLSTTAASAEAWPAGDYKQQVTVVANHEIDLAQTVAALYTDPALDGSNSTSQVAGAVTTLQPLAC